MFHYDQNPFQNSFAGNPWRIEVFMPASDSTTSPTQQGFSLGGMNNVILAPINLSQLPGGALSSYNYLANLYSNANAPMQTGTGGTTTTFRYLIIFFLMMKKKMTQVY